MTFSGEQMATGSMLNAISIDVEGFIEANLQSFTVPAKYIDHQKELYEIEHNTETVLQLLDSLKIRATFFVVGRIARELPKIVAQIAKHGHEIGCHNYEHKRIFDLDQAEFKIHLLAAKQLIEDVSQQKVHGFRAPDFSITTKSIWAIDVLKETGFIYDSSIYPVGMHDVYGIVNANPFPYKFPNGLVEFPLATTTIFNKRLPFGGGGYFRLYPLRLTKMFLNKLNQQGHPGMFYIHPYEVGDIRPQIKEMSAYRRFRHYYNCQKGFYRLKAFLPKFKFGTALEVIQNCKL
jgi:polysaccharide deacetylase family protein (PEP-CTERM system associated)